MRRVLRCTHIEKKITISEMAKKLNITKSFYYKIESGTCNTNLDFTAKTPV